MKKVAAKQDVTLAYELNLLCKGLKLAIFGILFPYLALFKLYLVTSSKVFSGRYSLVSNQNTGMSEQQRGYLFCTNTVIPHKNSQQAHARLASTLDLRHSRINTRPLP